MGSVHSQVDLGRRIKVSFDIDVCEGSQACGKRKYHVEGSQKT